MDKYAFWTKSDHLAYFKSKDPRPVIEDRWSHLREMARLKLSAGALLRFEWIAFYHTVGKRNATATAKHFGISRKTLHKWLNRFDERNLLSLEERSRRPKRTRGWQVTPLEEVRIIKLRKKKMVWGKMKLAKIYERTYGEYISSWKVQRVIERHNLYPDTPTTIKRRKRRKTNKVRIQKLRIKKRTGFLLHLDTIVRYYDGIRRYIITAVDDTSRVAYARMYKTATSASAEDFLKRLYYLLDGQIENVHTDNGSEFHKHFIQACVKYNLTQYWSRPRTPKDNSKLERFNRTIQEEFMDYECIYDPVDQVDKVNKQMTEWLIEYNFVRPHTSLDYLTPWQYATAYANPKVLPMYSSHTIPCRPGA